MAPISIVSTMVDPDLEAHAVTVVAMAVMVAIMTVAAVMTVMAIPGKRLAAQAETEQRNSDRYRRKYMS